MEVYNLIHFLGRVRKLTSFRTGKSRKQTEKQEGELHKTLRPVQVNLSKPKIWLRYAQQFLLLLVLYVLLAKGRSMPEWQALILVGLLGRLSRSFGALVKVGISKNTKTRIHFINDDISSGRTEWHLIPWLCVPLIPVLT